MVDTIVKSSQLQFSQNDKRLSFDLNHKVANESFQENLKSNLGINTRLICHCKSWFVFTVYFNKATTSQKNWQCKCSFCSGPLSIEIWTLRSQFKPFSIFFNPIFHIQIQILCLITLPIKYPLDFMSLKYFEKHDGDCQLNESK